MEWDLLAELGPTWDYYINGLVHIQKNSLASPRCPMLLNLKAQDMLDSSS